MGLWRRNRAVESNSEATARWEAAVSYVDTHYQELAALPLDEAVEVVYNRTPQHFTRDELRARLARARNEHLDLTESPRQTLGAQLESK